MTRPRDSKLLAPLSLPSERSRFLHAQKMAVEGDLPFAAQIFKAQFPQRMLNVASLWRGDLDQIGPILKEMSFE